MKSRKSSLADDDDSRDYEPPRKFQREERHANKANASQGMLLPGLPLPGLPGLNIPAQQPRSPPEVQAWLSHLRQVREAIAHECMRSSAPIRG